MMHCTTLGIDVAKNEFQLHGVDKRGHVVVRKRMSRAKLRETIARLPACVIGMEACSTVQYWVREFQQFGHTVKLISPQLVKPESFMRRGLIITHDNPGLPAYAADQRRCVKVARSWCT
jgi:transposase